MSADTGEGVVYANDYVTVALVPSEFGPFTTVTSGAGRGAVVLARSGDDVLAVRQTRWAVGRETVEVPRGGTHPGEGPREAAVRELREEVGVSVEEGSLVDLGSTCPDTGLLTTVVDLFYVDLPPGLLVGVTDGECAETVLVPVDELVASAVSGSNPDALTCLAVLRARLRGLL